MTLMVDVELAGKAGFTADAGGECEIEVGTEAAGGAATAPAFTVYSLTVMLAGHPAIRCERDFHDEVAGVLAGREDAEPDYTDEELLADAPGWLAGDPLAEAVFSGALADVVAAAGGSMAVGDIAALASGAWDKVEVIA